MSARDVSRIIKEISTVDVTTGEYLKQTTESILRKEPDYVKLYLRDIALLNNLRPSTNNILYELLKLMDYRNRIVLNSALKKEIATEIGVSVKTIDNALNLLLKQNIVLRKGVGLFIGNPNLFGKGEWRDIRELRMTVTFNEEGRTISTEVIKDEGDESEEEMAFNTDVMAVSSIVLLLSFSFSCFYQLLI